MAKRPKFGYKITINKHIETGGIFTNFSLHLLQRDVQTKDEYALY
jgi:hypothetical protein